MASWLAQRPVQVHCLTQKETDNDEIIVFWGADAYVLGMKDDKGVWRPFDWTVFRHGLCEILLKLEAGQAADVPTEELAWAILVITHESGHLRGWGWSANEAKTQCWAMRHFRYVAQRFGVVDTAPLVAAALELHSRMPLNYQLSSCKLPSP